MVSSFVLMEGTLVRMQMTTRGDCCVVRTVLYGSETHGSMFTRKVSQEYAAAIDVSNMKQNREDRDRTLLLFTSKSHRDT